MQKLRIIQQLICYCLVLNVSCQTNNPITSTKPRETKKIVQVDWQNFIARHDLIWTQSPKNWYDGPFLGNGMLGSMLHQIDENTIRISLGRADIEDHKTSGHPFVAQSRLPNGYFTLKTVGKITGFEARLDLYNAELRAKITTKKGSIELKGIVHSNDMVIYYEFESSGKENAENLNFVPLKAIAPARLQADLEVAELGDKVSKARKNWANLPYEYNSDPELTAIDSYQISKQSLVAGGETGTAWLIKKDKKGKKQLFISIEHSFPEKTAVSKAINHLKAIENKSIKNFTKRHRTWWHNYYPKSFISLDDTKMESFYWIQVYKFGAGARKGRAFMDTMGPWMVENTAWANGWFNLNTQLSYWFLTTANRMEVAESLFSKLDEKLPTLVANMPKKYGGNSAGMSTIVPQTFISKFPSGKLGFTGELLWTCHNYWLMLERSMDTKRTTEKFFPLLKKTVNTYLYFMVEGEDGKVHLPPTKSPEYGGGEDCNFNLSLFKWGLKKLIYIDEKHQINDPLLLKWKDVLARLVDYPTNKNGYMVAKDFPFEKSHRHYSHLLMIYPLCEVNIDQPENIELIEKSVDHWINYPGSGNAGYSWSGAAAMYALQGNGKKAAEYLDTFMNMQKLYPNNPAKIHPTTMYTETNRMQPVTETPLSLCDAMQQMLLQSWGGTIRVFPAVPKSWENISFQGLLAAGGFEITASRKNGKTEFIQIKSIAGEPCILKTALNIHHIEGIKKSAIKNLGDGKYEIDLKKGEEVILFAAGINEAIVKPVAANPDALNSFGVNEKNNKNDTKKDNSKIKRGW